MKSNQEGKGTENNQKNKPHSENTCKLEDGGSNGGMVHKSDVRIILENMFVVSVQDNLLFKNEKMNFIC